MKIPELASAAIPSVKVAVPATVMLVPSGDRVSDAFEKFTTMLLPEKLRNGLAVNGLAVVPSEMSEMLAVPLMVAKLPVCR